jgi:hypothetical protein
MKKRKLIAEETLGRERERLREGTAYAGGRMAAGVICGLATVTAGAMAATAAVSGDGGTAGLLVTAALVAGGGWAMCGAVFDLADAALAGRRRDREAAAAAEAQRLATVRRELDGLR